MQKMRAFDRSMVVQVRTLSAVRQIAHLPSGIISRLPTKEELQRFLGFLGLRALASSFHYDSTIPDKYRDEFVSNAIDLGLHSNTDRLPRPDIQTLVEDTRIAASMACNNIRSQLEEPPPAWMDFDTESISRFFTYLGALYTERNAEQRLSIGVEAYESGAQGGKLLLGLSSEENEDLLRVVARVSNSGKHSQQDIMSMLINNFRPFLLSSWSASNGSVFAGEPSAVNVLGAYKRMLWTELEQALRRKQYISATGSDLNPQPTDRFVHALPMLGLAVLAVAPNHARPIELIEGAYEYGKQLDLMAIQACFLNLQKQVAERGDSALEHCANDIWRRVRKIHGSTRDRGVKGIKRATHHIVPAIVGGLNAYTAAQVAKLPTAWPWKAFCAGSLSFLLAKVFSYDRVAVAMSNMMTLSDTELACYEEKIESIWRPYKHGHRVRTRG